jgi:hypothetical protein
VNPSGLPRALVADFMAHRRLALIAALRDGFAPEAPPPGADLLRHARQSRPELAVLFVHPWRPDKALRQCRWLKTDLHPIRRVAVINPDGPPRDPRAVIEDFQADGYWQGGGSPAEQAAFLRRVWGGERPVEVRPSAMGLLARLLAR